MTGAWWDNRPMQEIARLARALGHPLRVQILAEFANGPTSAARISKQLGVSLSNVNYHTKVLYDPCAVIVLSETRQVRGTHESIYRLKRSPVHDLAAALANALQAMPIDEPGHGTFTWTPLEIDEQGWSEIEDALSRAHVEIEDAQGKSRQRLQESGPQPKITAIVAGATVRTRVLDQMQNRA